MRAPRAGACWRAAVAVLPLLVLGCADRKEPARPEHPLVMIGVDGMEWRVLKPLLHAGRMPNLQGLIERGASGFLYTFKPTWSPVVWTSIATGKRPEHHGIVHFLQPSTRIPFTSNSRRGRALWNVASMYGLKTLCVGWWVTYPAEEIDGWMVAPYSSGGQNTVNWKGNLMQDLPDQTWPRDLIDEIWPIAERVTAEDAFLAVDRPYFGDVDLEKLDETERKLVGQTRWSVAADAVFSEIALHLLRRPDVEPDLTMVYLGGPDVASHRFWRYMSPGEFFYRDQIPADSIAELQDVIARFYTETDRRIGELLAAAPPDANVIVCSDHGFHAEATRQPHPTGLSGDHQDGPAGVIVMAGPAIRSYGAAAALDPGRPPARMGRVLEVAPVVHHLLGIPLARRAQYPDGGSLMRTALLPEFLARHPPAPSVDSHDEGFRAPSEPLQVSAQGVEDITEWMDQLGYLQGLDQENEFQETLPGEAAGGADAAGGARDG